MAKRIQFEGRVYNFPDDATDDEISQQLAAEHDRSLPNAGLAQPSGDPRRYGVKEWGGGIFSTDPTDPRFGGSTKQYHGPFHELTSAENLGGWTEQGPGEIGGGVIDMAHGRIARGGHRVISGGMTTALPATAPLAVTAPLHTAAAIGSGYAGGKLLRAITGAAGGNEEQQQFADDIGNVVGGYGGARGLSPAVRGTGRLLEMSRSIPDLPVSETLPRSTNALSRMINAAKQPASRVGSRMSQYGRPPAIRPDTVGKYREPDLPSVRPDGQVHYNDVTDQGELNRLLDSIHQQSEPGPRIGRGQDPVQPDAQAHYNDVHPPLAQPDEVPTEDLVRQVQRGAVLPSAQAARTVNNLPTNTADLIPTPASDTLLNAIRSASGWPENGLPNRPWDVIHAEDELPQALDTDPYNRQPNQMIQSPTYTGPERRSIGRGEILPPEYDAFDEGMGHGIYDPNEPSRNIPENFIVEGRPTPKELPRMIGSQSDADADTAAFNQARQELPNGTLSDHLRRAQEIKMRNQSQ